MPPRAVDSVASVPAPPSPQPVVTTPPAAVQPPPAPTTTPASESVPEPVPSPAPVAELETVPVAETVTPSSVANAPAAKAPRAAGLRKAKQAVVAPTGGIKAKALDDAVEPTPGALIDPTWSEDVTAEGLEGAWASFVEKLRADDRIALVATMSLGVPELRGSQVVYAVNNPLQREQMDGLRTEVLVHLKTELKNAQLELHLEMKEQAMEEKKAFLSDKDRYDMMVEKNPALDKLRKALDLDLG